ncbi:flagellar basal body rod protein FlgC [Thalassococcus sp. CAU 1522]|uniref:Flagellar basal body rod protein FlgC n=1 Tax=Thalassococcus arenae TaxID=2851652 RepID=A0ABS6N5P5_9RHOB|nr:flagellar basal body rod protein FlgC [Thalassococcus arenae]MBV2359332.1 flagellar basal body rod protein FlgC [Thalassococcus arenae]
MSAFSDALAVTSSGLKAQATRLRLVSENIANVDTPGYRRKLAAFELTGDADTVRHVETGRIRLDQSERQVIHDPAHPLAGDDGTYVGSNVDLILEIADAREAQRSYEANLKMFEQTRQMSGALLDLLRR